MPIDSSVETLLVQVSDRRADVHDDAGIGDILEELSHPLEVVHRRPCRPLPGGRARAPLRGTRRSRSLG